MFDRQIAVRSRARDALVSDAGTNQLPVWGQSRRFALPAPDLRPKLSMKLNATQRRCSTATPSNDLVVTRLA